MSSDFQIEALKNGGPILSSILQAARPEARAGSEVTRLAHAQSDYRRDIDGLRALAILPVILFHAGFSGVGGGFVGVDVFFVISGYLITSIIIKDVIKGRYSTLTFYERRIRRIIPALGLVVLCSFAAAVFILLPYRFVSLSVLNLWLSFFGSNVYLWHQYGYFSPQAENIPFLHTWSLAVEEQFYVFFPLLIVFLLKVGVFGSRTDDRGRRAFIAVIGGLALLSLLLGVYQVNFKHKSIGAFYLMPTRAWELLLGSLLAIGAAPRLKNELAVNCLSVVGVAFIIFAVVSYSNETTFPGIAALPPTLGAAILIYTGSDERPWANQLLSSRLLVTVGLISYSLYLWHWPLLVLAAAAHGSPLGFAEKALILLLSAALAAASWFFVERPFRLKLVCGTRRQLMVGAALLLVIVSALSLFVIQRGGFVFPVSAQARSLVEANARAKEAWTYPEDCASNFRRDPAERFAFCSVPAAAGGNTVLFWGDSMIEQLYPLAQDIMKAHPPGVGNITFATSGGCPPVLGFNRPRYFCDKVSRMVLERAMRPDVTTVVLGARLVLESDLDRDGRYLCKADGGACAPFADRRHLLDYFQAQLREQLTTLVSAHKRIVVLLPFPSYEESIPEHLMRAALAGRAPAIELTRERHVQMTQAIAEILREEAAAIGATVVDPADALCARGSCLYERGGVSLYRDKAHLTPEGVLLLKPLLSEALGRWRAPPPE